MGSKTKYTREEFITAIEGSGGIKQIVADRLNVTRHTVDNYLKRWVSAREAYEQECQVNLDIADSIVITNLRIQHQRQRADGEEVDTSDAKWYLTMKGSKRGYASKQRIDVTSDDKPLKSNVIIVREVLNDDSEN